MALSASRRRWPAAAAAYCAAVFAIGFAAGTIRVLLLVPWLGARGAELTELPFMVLASWWAARRVCRRLAPRSGRGERLAIGFTALGCLLALELTLAWMLRGASPVEALLDRDLVAGAAYYVALLLFALMPALAGAPDTRRVS